MIEKRILDGFRSPGNAYRPLPFWSWNEHLNVEETRWQISEMERVGIGGYFMHARGGLQTAYMGPEWMKNIAAGIEEARARGMEAWAYDENGWPSGFGNGLVNGKGEVFQQKYLRFEASPVPVEREDGRTIINVPLDGQYLHFYYDVNPFYVDTLNRHVISEFLETIYSPYAERFSPDFGSAMPGFFTDEPQISRNGIPWSHILPSAYKEVYGEDLLLHLPELFRSVGDFRRTRFRFWHLVQELFVTAFTQQIYDWCERHGGKLTGHMVLEETFLSQLTSNGAVMPHYEFFHMPGMDWLGRHIDPITTPLQVSSVANQLGRNQVLSETFALTGWNVSFEELRWMYEWQMAHGVTRLCQHLQGYSLRGIRKRDYPPSLFYQQPWWDSYRTFNDMVSRIGFLLAEGVPETNVLILHPQSSAWLLFDNERNTGMPELFQAFMELSAFLEAHHIPFHYGDERILSRHGSVAGNRLQVGRMSYATVIVPSCDTIDRYTCRLLQEYASAGGLLIWAGRKPSLVEGEPSALLEPLLTCGVTGTSLPVVLDHISEDTVRAEVTDAEGKNLSAIQVTTRSFPDATGKGLVRLLYLVNRDNTDAVETSIQISGKALAELNPVTGSITPRAIEQEKNGRSVFRHRFEPCCSLLLLCSDKPAVFGTSIPVSRPHRFLEKDRLEGKWELFLDDPNALTLDTCTYWFDGILQEENAHISAIQKRALDLRRPVRIEMLFTADTLPGYQPPDDCALVLETPERISITVNGRPLAGDDSGFYRDKSFRRIPLGNTLAPGRNEIRLSLLFEQSEEVYQNLERATVFEAEKNKLTYDVEIEAIYLTGSFGVSTPGSFEELPRQATRYSGPFLLAPLPRMVNGGGDLVPQGLPFFNGRLRLKKEIELSEDEVRGIGIRFQRMASHVAGLQINGTCVGQWMWRPFETAVLGSDTLRTGRNEFELELTIGLRNLLGPHHLQEGESYAVAPRSFFREPNIWGSAPWNDAYCFVRAGIDW